jgi:osmoprotectant transport system ATP-binding protein
MISVKQLNKTYNGTAAVTNISFDVAEGETLVLLGTSGCGKTTTLRMINRLIRPDSGEVFINGKDVQSLKPEILRRGIGYVLQNHGLFPHYTIAENIAIVPKLLKWSGPEISKRVDELFEKLNLQPSLKRMYPSELSGGQQQRVGLARALMANPPVLLMDEPFGSLDNLTRIHIRREFKVLDELVKKTIVMVTHDVQEAFEMGDRICLMDKGRIVQIGTAEELLFKPANEFVSGFLNDQRLQLELKSVKLAELFTDSGKEGSKSVWEKMDEVVNDANGAKKDQEFKIGDLMDAFQAYKKK